MKNLGFKNYYPLVFSVLLFAICFLLLANITSAQILYKPQIPIPEFEKPVEITGKTLAEYIQALFNWGIPVIATLAVIMIMVAGFKWMISRGNPSEIGKAKDMISNALVALILVLGSHFLLSFINPSLVHLKELDIKKIETIYIDLCRDVPADQQPPKSKETVKEKGTEWAANEWWCPIRYNIKPKPGVKTAGQCWGDWCPQSTVCDVRSHKCVSPGDLCLRAHKALCSDVDKKIGNGTTVCRPALNEKRESIFCYPVDVLNCPNSHPTRVNCNENNNNVCWNVARNQPWAQRARWVYYKGKWHTVMAWCQDKEVRAGKTIDLICCKNAAGQYKRWKGVNSRPWWL